MLGTPSRARYLVVVFAIILAIIQYIDRVAISQAAPLISKDLGLDKAQMAWVFSAFTLAYAALRDPDRLLGRPMGARRVLIRVVLWWSFFTAATGWVWNSGLALRRAVPVRRRRGRLLPEHRPRLQPMAAARRACAGAGHPVDVGALGRRRRAAAARPRAAVRELAAAPSSCSPLLGVVWCVFWYRWFRDKPADHPKVNAAELALMPTFEGKSDHPHVPWSVMFSSLSLWLLWLQYFTLSYAWYFFVTWFPTYLNEVHKYDLKVQGALMAGLPLFFGGFGSLFAGYITPAHRPA